MTDCGGDSFLRWGALPFHQTFVSFSRLQDLIPELFRINPHATARRYLERFQTVRSLDEFPFLCLNPLGPLVFPK